MFSVSLYAHVICRNHLASLWWRKALWGAFGCDLVLYKWKLSDSLAHCKWTLGYCLLCDLTWHDMCTDSWNYIPLNFSFHWDCMKCLNSLLFKQWTLHLNSVFSFLAVHQILLQRDMGWALRGTHRCWDADAPLVHHCVHICHWRSLRSLGSLFNHQIPGAVSLLVKFPQCVDLGK